MKIATILRISKIESRRNTLHVVSLVIISEIIRMLTCQSVMLC